MNYHLNYNYSLRKNINGEYTLYNKASLKTYYISRKLYYILKYFLYQSIPISYVEDEGRKYGIDLSDFFRLLNQKEFTDLLVHEEIYTTRIGKYDLTEKELPPGTMFSPERVEFFITKHCNLSCKHCFEGSAPKFPIKEFTSSEMERIVNQLEVAGIKTLKITGGEPFTHPNIDELVALLSKVHFETMILTNALLLNERRIELIKKNNIQLGISLDGMSSITHDFIRGQGSFIALKKVLLALRRSKVTFSVTCTANKMNLSEIDGIIDYVLGELNANSLFISRLRSIGRAVDNNELVLNNTENNFVQDICMAKQKKYGERLILADDSTMKAQSVGNRIACSAGNSIFALDENFDIYPCIFGIGHNECKIGNLLTNNISEIWRSSKWNAYRGGTLLSDLRDCKGCRLNKLCVMKNCRLRPVFEGQSFYDAVSYCEWKSLARNKDAN